MVLSPCTEALVRFIFSLLKYAWDSPGTILIIGVFCVAAVFICKDELLLSIVASLINLIANAAVLSTGGLLFFLAAIPLGIITGILWALMVIGQSNMHPIFKIPVAFLAFFLGFARTLVPLPFIDVVWGFFLKIRITAIVLYIICSITLIFLLFDIPFGNLIPFVSWLCSSFNTILIWFN